MLSQQAAHLLAPAASSPRWPCLDGPYQHLPLKARGTAGWDRGDCLSLTQAGNSEATGREHRSGGNRVDPTGLRFPAPIDGSLQPCQLRKPKPNKDGRWWQLVSDGRDPVPQPMSKGSTPQACPAVGCPRAPLRWPGGSLGLQFSQAELLSTEQKLGSAAGRPTRTA